jgi:hypothetical protein
MQGLLHLFLLSARRPESDQMSPHPYKLDSGEAHTYSKPFLRDCQQEPFHFSWQVVPGPPEHILHSKPLHMTIDQKPRPDHFRTIPENEPLMGSCSLTGGFGWPVPRPLLRYSFRVARRWIPQSSPLNCTLAQRARFHLCCHPHRTVFEGFLRQG